MTRSHSAALVRFPSSSFLVYVLAGGVALGGCECASHERDAGLLDSGHGDSGDFDAGLDATMPLDAAVEPGPSCADAPARPTVACVEGGWFSLATWSAARVSWIPLLVEPAPQRRVYLDSFQLDAREVTNGEWQRAVADGTVTTPPERCGYEDRAELRRGPGPAPMVDETSGWIADTPQAGRENQPVVCVTREEARTFCADRGGRLPTVFEFMKVATTVDPSGPSRFPWGDEPPLDESGGAWPGRDEYLVVYDPDILPSPDALGTQDAMGREAGSSDLGVFDLAGNASELLETCGEELARFEGTAPLVRPASAESSRCSESVLVAGSNWRSWVDIDSASTVGSATVFRVVADETIQYAGSGTFPTEAFFSQWTRPLAGVAGTDPAGNDRRSWRVGFRCAYDVE